MNFKLKCAFMAILVSSYTSPNVAQNNQESKTDNNYELGFVQQGQEGFCQDLLEDFERHAPNKMDEYYKGEKFVQWTSGLSSASRKNSVGAGGLDNVQWAYIPVYNDGTPHLLVRFSDFVSNFDTSAFIGGGGHSIALGDIVFSNGATNLNVKNAFWQYRRALEYEVIEPYWSAINYYKGLGAREKTVLKNLEGQEEKYVREYIEKDTQNCISCDYSQDKKVLLRREYLYQKGFFRSDIEIKNIVEKAEKLVKGFPSLANNSQLDEVVKQIPKDIKPDDFHQVNVIYERGIFYFLYRKTQSDTAVVFNFSGKNNFQEVCYIGPKTTTN